MIKWTVFEPDECCYNAAYEMWHREQSRKVKLNKQTNHRPVVNCHTCNSYVEVACVGQLIPTNVTWSKNSQWKAHYRSSHDNNTRGPAIAQGLRDVHCQLKSCQLLHRCTRNPIWKHLQRVTDREAHSRVDDLWSPAGWLPVHRDLLRAQHSVLSKGKPLPFLQCTLLPVTLKSAPVLKTQFKFQATHALSFMSTYTVVTTWYICWGMGVRKVFKQQKYLQGHCCWCHLIGHIWQEVLYGLLYCFRQTNRQTDRQTDMATTYTTLA